MNFVPLTKKIFVYKSPRKYWTMYCPNCFLASPHSAWGDALARTSEHVKQKHTG